ncbi:hypothetical protein Csa_018256 [Cucumis sativus]|nr:hypothetical protein Csa_018256 [Cucumis sativus]
MYLLKYIKYLKTLLLPLLLHPANHLSPSLTHVGNDVTFYRRHARNPPLSLLQPTPPPNIPSTVELDSESQSPCAIARWKSSSSWKSRPRDISWLWAEALRKRG